VIQYKDEVRPDIKEGLIRTIFRQVGDPIQG